MAGRTRLYILNTASTTTTLTSS